MAKKIWFTPLSLQELKKRSKNTLVEHLGIEFVEVGPNFLTASMSVDAKTHQPMGILHGGASAALAETVASAAGNYCIDQSQEVAVGLDLNINHIRPVKMGKIMAKAIPFHLGKMTQVWEIQTVDEEGKLVSIARLTLAVKKKSPL